MDTSPNVLKRPTRNDVAALANVSGCTVSYVLNGRQDIVIAPATRERVLDAAKQLGYRPNRAARALVTGTTQVVSLWAGSLSPYYAMITTHLRDQIKASGFQMLISDIETSISTQAPGLWPGDGIISIEYPEHMDTFLHRHPDLHTPIISIGAFHLEQVDYVGVDLYGGTRDAIDHLLGIGCRRIAYVHEEAPRGLQDARTTSYADGMKAAGRPTEDIVVPSPSRAGARQGIREYIAKYGCPDGLFCHNDDTAIGVYRGLCDLGIQVPEQVAIVGCDGIEDTEYLECPITTIVQPVEAMCAMGWEFLKRRMADPAIPLQQHICKTTLAIRGSTAAPRTPSISEPKEAPSP
ncbi:MAG: LacI family DNA-binding transcriptional regulator [Fimbriimonas sp.]|nr:LacI family DNA-binding transcriptional regulator [Fimbriimonas sp.]